MNNEYLTFLIEGEEYAVNILNVQEVRSWESVRTLPNMPSYLMGVIDLRGDIVPIVDMRKRFGLNDKAIDATTVVIILRSKGRDDQNMVMGIIVDAVSEVYQIDSKDIKRASQLDKNKNMNFIKGLASISDKLLVVIELEKLMDINELHDAVNIEG